MEEKGEDEWRKGEERCERANGIKTGSSFTAATLQAPSPPLPPFHPSLLPLPSPLPSPPLTAVWSWQPPPCSDLTGEVERRDGSC